MMGAWWFLFHRGAGGPPLEPMPWWPMVAGSLIGFAIYCAPYLYVYWKTTHRRRTK
jgi:hypothetical protein